MLRASAGLFLAVVFPIWLAYMLACGAYLDLLVLAARRYRPRPLGGTPATPFVLLIPAHDEAESIEKTLDGLQSLNYPAGLLRCLVIADNCTDDTAERARTAGAEVWVRSEPEQPGKGAALRWALDRLGPPPAGQAVAVLDADSTASTAWLRRADAYLRAGADAVQPYYGIANEDAGWRTRLLGIALLLLHHVRPAGREVLGWSAGLRGNGMIFTRRLLDRVPWSDSITEDLEYASRLAASGVRTAYDGGSQVLGLAGSGARAMRSQRLRWEGGRFGVIRQWAVPLLTRAVISRSLLAWDAAMELLVLPLGLLVLLGVTLTALTAAAAAARLAWSGWLIGAIASLGLLGGYVVGGMRVSRASARQYAALAAAPAYLAWKVLVYAWLLLGVQGGRWVRTDRRAT